jgi:hypothetical protein
LGGFEDNSFSIGLTPLVRLNRATDGGKAIQSTGDCPTKREKRARFG